MQALTRWFMRSLTPAVALPTLAAVVLSSLLGLAVVDRLEQAHQQAVQNTFARETGEVTLRIEERLKAYRQVLSGARALFQASRDVSRSEWQSYVAALNLPANYPGIQGVGFAMHVSADQRARHEERIHAEGFPEYRISPPGPRSDYGVIVYLEPFDWRNQRAFGYDMLSEPVRREAMTRALQLAACRT